MPAVPAAVAGRVLALASALGYGASLPLSRLAFDEGTNALTVCFLRYVALSVLLAAWLAASRRPGAALAPRERATSLLLGVCFASVSLGTLLGATWMAVSLTVLVFYTHPSLILLAAALMDRRRPRLLEIAVLAMAFAGLALALDVGLGQFSVTGLVFAALAALGALASFVLIERALPRADPVRATTVAALSAAVASGVVLAGLGEAALPATSAGWGLLCAVIGLFATGVVCMFLAIRLAGSVRASMLLFLEPVTAVLLAVALIGERLSALQWLGAGLVIAAVALASTSGPPTHPEEVVG